MFTGANMQYVFQNGVLPDVMTPPGILLENAHTKRMFPSQKAYNNNKRGCDLDKVFIMGFALKSRISKIKNIEYILTVILIQSLSLFICF